MDLQRFVTAQDDHDAYDRALAEVAGRGQSPRSRTYAVADLAGARTYLSHDVLGPRLRECCRAPAGPP